MSRKEILDKKVSVMKKKGQQAYTYTVELTNLSDIAIVSGEIKFPGYEKSGDFQLSPGESKTIVIESPAPTPINPVINITDQIIQA